MCVLACFTHERVVSRVFFRHTSRLFCILESIPDALWAPRCALSFLDPFMGHAALVQDSLPSDNKTQGGWTSEGMLTSIYFFWSLDVCHKAHAFSQTCDRADALLFRSISHLWKTTHDTRPQRHAGVCTASLVNTIGVWKKGMTRMTCSFLSQNWMHASWLPTLEGTLCFDN